MAALRDFAIGYSLVMDNDGGDGVFLGRSLSAEEEELAHLMRALGHPARVRIMGLLIARNACVCGDIVDQLPLAQSTVSQHLKQLKLAGLIQVVIDGPRVCYCVNPPVLERLRFLFHHLLPLSLTLKTCQPDAS